MFIMSDMMFPSTFTIILFDKLIILVKNFDALPLQWCHHHENPT